MADESNDTRDRPENTDSDGFAPAASEVAAPEPTQEPLEGPDVELPTGEPSPAISEDGENAVADALPEPLEGPDVELPTGDETAEAPASDDDTADAEPVAAAEPVAEAEPEAAAEAETPSGRRNPRQSRSPHRARSRP